MKVLVLGSRGMVGHVMTAYLEERGGFDVVNISRTHPFNERTVIMDLDRKRPCRFFLIAIRSTLSSTAPGY